MQSNKGIYLGRCLQTRKGVSIILNKFIHLLINNNIISAILRVEYESFAESEEYIGMKFVANKENAYGMQMPT